VLDRHPLWLSELGQVLERAGLELVGTTTSEAHALQLLRQHQPEILVFEPEACTSQIPRFLEAARSAASSLKAVAVSSVDDPEAIRATLRSGAWAYVLKNAPPQDIAVAVRQSFAPSIYLAGAVDVGETVNATPVPQSNGGLSVLTRREREILTLVAEGHSNSAMAKRLWVTEQTVKFHLSNIYRKLGVANRTAASRWAHEHGATSAAPAAGEPNAVGAAERAYRRDRRYSPIRTLPKPGVGYHPFA
jgi:DNA-binding NarL/FixJ family response regulator